jgi:hypothetical protein
MKFLSDLIDTAGEEISKEVDFFLDTAFKAVFDPFGSSSSSDKPSDDNHSHCYPCRDEDCDRR